MGGKGLFDDLLLSLALIEVVMVGLLAAFTETSLTELAIPLAAINTPVYGAGVWKTHINGKNGNGKTNGGSNGSQ